MTGQGVEPLSGSSDMPDRLGRFPIFSALDQGTLRILAVHAQSMRWPAGGLMFQRGDVGDHMLAIVEGRVRLTLTSAQGRELLLRQLGPGDILGELAIIDGLPRSAEASAVEPTTAIVLRRDRFLEVAKQRTELGLAFASYLCSLIRSTNFQMESIALHSLKGRLIRFLLLSLNQAYTHGPPKAAMLALNLNQSDLSSILGASRPKLNQAFQTLIQDGAISRSGDGIQCNVARLRELAELDAPGSDI
jgi:CRP/FNR family transcriptional regulator, cyclic AMP receptor protein